MAADLQALAGLLQASIDPRQRRAAEHSLKEEEEKPNFSLSVLQIVASDQFSETIRLAGALFFKNFIKRNWIDENGNHKLSPNEITTIKSQLIGLMVKVPAKMQSQLGDAISVIAESDFYESWDTLVDDLVARLTPDNAAVNDGVLQVAHSIFKRWEPLFRSDALFTEINHVLSRFSTPYLQVWTNTDLAIDKSAAKPQVLKEQFSTLDLIIKLFYDLSCQDLPPVFEDHLQTIAALLHKYLTYDNPALHTDDDDDEGPLEKVKAGIFKALVLYTKKYEDAFGPLLVQFVNTGWSMLTSIGQETKYDLLVSRALEFLTTVASRRHHAESFNTPEILSQVVEKVVLPNMSLRESDVEMFEDEPIEFIRRDLEGSDEDTRRRAATNFLKTLMEQFEKPVTDVVLQYVDHFLKEYAKDRTGKWQSKDTAVHLFSSVAAKGVSTAARGVLSVNSYVDVLDFFQKNIAKDLTNADAQPLLKVDAIKYLYTFRSILSQEQWQVAFPLLVQHLNSTNYVVYTYAAIAVDRALYLTNDKQHPVIPRDIITPLAKDLLSHLFTLMTRDSRPEKVQENEFLMKCVMRVLIVIREDVPPVTDVALKSLIAITKVIRHNPSNPGFCYYHFESLGALIRFAGPTQSGELETALFEPFAEVLNAQVEEFTPYIFQLFAALLAASPPGPLSPAFQSLLAPILVPKMWESRGNIPALTRLLITILPRGAEQIAAANQTEAILIIFQKLVSSKANETHAMDLIETVVSSFSVAALEPYWVTMLSLLLSRLSSSPTEHFKLRFVRFYHLVSASTDRGMGADFFISIADRVQANVFTPIYTSIILPDTQKLSRPADRKTAVMSLTRTLADSQAFVDRYAKRGWTITCEALIKLLINPPLPPAADDNTIEDRDIDELGFGSAFTQLNTCKRLTADPWPEVQDVKKWVGETLSEADERHGGRIARFVNEKLDDQGKLALGSVMQG